MSSGPEIDCLLTIEPLLNAKRNVMAIRVRAHVGTDTPAPTLSQLFGAFDAVLPDEANPVLLSVDTDRIDEPLLEMRSRTPIWLEMPVDYLLTDTGRSVASKLAAERHKLVLLGPPHESMKPQALTGFSMALLSRDQDAEVQRRKAASGPFGGKDGNLLRRVPFAQIGVTRIKDIDHSFQHGTVACVGWPYEDLRSQAAHSNAIPDFSTLSELIVRLDRGADVGELEEIIRRDAALSFRLLRLVNSAAFGLRVQIESFRHVVLMLGYLKLKRWLALMLANSSRDLNTRPIMSASFRRALFLENLRKVCGDERQIDEVFLLGVFSMLDKLFGEPFAKLFESLKVPPEVYEALAKRSGAFLPWLQIVEAIDGGAPDMLAQALQAAGVSRVQCNAALLKTLATPDVSRNLQ